MLYEAQKLPDDRRAEASSGETGKLFSRSDIIRQSTSNSSGHRNPRILSVRATQKSTT
jgi:hypothetical protein